jgi:GNAT superfamily N-acetyltransferase
MNKENIFFTDSSQIGQKHTPTRENVKMATGGNVLLAPNGQPSKLTPEQYNLVRTPAFKKWFGDWENDPENASKVVDENGEPLPVYHGTTEDFTTFQEKSYFTDDYMNADGYANGEIVIEAFLNLKNPLIINAKGRKWDDIKSKCGTSTRDIVGALDQEKYDGVIFYKINDNWFDDEGEPQNVYNVNKPNQIKLADGTNTTFDPNNDDIRFENGGSLEEEAGNNDVLESLFNNTEDITPIKINGRTVGGIDVTTYRGDTETLRVHKMLILPEFQGKGLGAKAIKKLFRENPNVKQIIGNATAESKPFWQKIGAEFHSNEHTAFTITRNPDIRYKKGGVLKFQSSKSLTIKNGTDLYKVQYRRNELGNTDKNVWFADVVSKNGKEVDGRLCVDNSRALNIYGFSLKEVENNIFEAYNSNELYIIIVDEYGVEIENTHIEKSNNENIRFFENGGEIDSKVENAKAELLKAFPTLNNLDFLGKGRFGYSFLIEINNELYVVKYTTSITEFWATKMAMVSNAPHVVKFLDAKELSEQFTYGIIHEYVNRDGMINEDVWNYALLKADGLSPRKQGLNIDEIRKKVPPKALEYEINLVTKLVNELKSFFGTDLDLLQQNWGYNSNGELVLFDLDGNIKKSQYLEWMEKYKNEPKMAGGGNIDINEPFYVNGKTLAERVRILLKQLYPDYKWSVTSSYNKLDVYLLEADFDPLTEKWKEEHPDRELYYNVDDRDLRETNREDGNLTDRAIEVFKPIREYIDRFVYNRNADDPYADYSDYNIYEYTYIGKWDKPYVQVAPKTGKKAKKKSPATPTVAPTPAPPKVEYPFQIGDVLAVSQEKLNKLSLGIAGEISQFYYEVAESINPFSRYFIKYNEFNQSATITVEVVDILNDYVKATAPLFKKGDTVVRKSFPNNPLKVVHRSYYEQIAVKYSTLEKRFLLSGMYWNYALEDATYANESDLELYSATHSIASYTTPNDVFTIQNIVSKTPWSDGLKKSMIQDFVNSGYEDISPLIGANKEETSSEIQKKVDGFASEKNTYLQANMLAEIIHKLIDVGNLPIPATTPSATNIENTFLDYLLANNEKANEIPKTLELSSALAMFLVSAEKVGGLDTKKYAGLLTELLNNFEKTKTDGSN